MSCGSDRRLGDEIERPERGARARIPGANHGPGLRADEDVLVDDRRRLHRRAHLDEPTIAELERELPGLGVDRQQARAG